MKLQRKINRILLFFIVCGMLCDAPFMQKMVFAANTDKEASETESDSEESADAKPAISETKITIPINEAVPEQLSVSNPEEDTVYIFKSGNKKIVEVKEKTGVLTGKKEGTAKVSLLKKGKKKNKLVGICTVTVKKAKIIKKHQKITASVGGVITPVISYKNSKADYTYQSADKQIVKVKEKIADTGATSIVVTALKEGKTTLTVKEKYKKKKTVVGKITVTVKNPVLTTQSISMVKGQTLKIANVVTVNHEVASKEVTYDYESSDKSVLSILGEKMTAEKVSDGVSLHVYRTVDGKRSQLGTVTVIIAEALDKTPEAVGDSAYIDLSDYNNDYEEGFDDYDDNDYYPIGADYIEDETADPDDSYDDYENYQDESEHIW